MASGRNDSAAPSAWPLAIGLAVVFALAMQSLGGVAVGAVLGYLLVQLAHLKHRIEYLAQDLADVREAKDKADRAAKGPLGSATAAPATATSAPPAPAVSVPPPTALPRPVVVATPAPPRPQPAPASAAAAAASAPSPDAESPEFVEPGFPIEPPPPDDIVTRAWAWLRGGNPLARMGIVILFFGAAFLAKYAAEHSLVPIEVRFAFIAAGALTLLVFGWRLRGSKPIYAHLLQGGGIAGLYLTVFAATKLYALLPPGLALGLMVVVAVTSAILAVAQDSLPLAVIGTAGGFLAPILVSTGSGNHIALFTYYTILNLGVFTVAWFRAWRVLNLIGFVFTFGIAGAFRANGYAPEKLFSTDCFVVLYFLMYVAISILFSLRQKPDLKGYVSASLVFGLPVAAFTLHASLISDIEYGLAWSALALGAFYLALSFVLLRTRRDDMRLLCEAFAALGVIFASLAVPLAFDEHTTAAMWAVEGAGLLWLGVRQQRRLARAFGALLQLFAGASYIVGMTRAAEALPFLNSAFIGTVMLAVSGWLSGFWMWRGKAQCASWEQGWSTAFALWATAWWLSGGLSEVHAAWPAYTLGAQVSFVAASAALLRWGGERRDWPLIRHIALFLLPLAALVGVNHAGDSHPLAELGFIAWPLLFATHLALLWRVEQETDSPLQRVLPAFHAGGAWLLTLLLAWELSWQLQREVAGVWRLLPWGLVPAFALWLLSQRPLRPRWPLAAHDATYRLLAAAPIGLFTVLWIVLVNVGSNGDPGPIQYLPLLNPLDVSVAIAMVSVAGAWLALEETERMRTNLYARREIFAIAAAIVFLWLNSALLRALHYTMGTPLTASGIAHSTLAQAALSIFWGLLSFSAMILAGRRASRTLWLIGAALMAVVVLKLFLVDTAGRGTLARIASFLVVGALLLVTGYLSPLPPSPSPEPERAT